MAKKTKQQREAARKLRDQKKQRKTMIINIILGTLLVAVFAGVAIYGVLQSRTAPELLTVNGSGLSAQTVNYYFRDSYDSFCTVYGDMIDSGKLFDRSQPLNTQTYSEGYSWANLFYDACKQTAIRGQLFGALAEADGWETPAEAAEAVETQLQELRSRAEEQGMTLEQFLKSFYGDTADEESYLAYLQHNAFAESYSKAYYSSLSFTDAELDAYIAQQEEPDTVSREDAQTALADEAWTQWAGELEEQAEITEVSDPIKYLYCTP